MLDLSSVQEESGLSLAWEGVGLAQPVGCDFFGREEGRRSTRRALHDRWGCTSHSTSGSCSNSVREENARDRSLCDGGGGHRSRDKFFLSHSDDSNFFNCHEETL